jgi:phi LC3 family holin
MGINWKLRLQNKTTLLALLTALVVFVYSVLSALGITPSITQEQAMNVVVALVALLGGLGIVVDPTTSGISDSAQAMKYEEPR